MTLEERLLRLEDVDAITQVTYRYARAVDKRPGDGVDLAAIPLVFTPDARWSSDTLGTTIGAAKIVAELPAATAGVELSAHAFLSPVIEIDGYDATGTWLLWIASVRDGQSRAVYLSADLRYRRTGAGWRIDAIHIRDGIRIPGD